MGRFSNITTSKYCEVLTRLGLECVRTNGGHEMWFKKGMLRNVVFQTHIEPVPEPIILNNNRTIGITSKQFEKALKES